WRPRPALAEPPEPIPNPPSAGGRHAAAGRMHLGSLSGFRRLFLAQSAILSRQSAPDSREMPSLIKPNAHFAAASLHSTASPAGPICPMQNAINPTPSRHGSQFFGGELTMGGEKTNGPGLKHSGQLENPPRLLPAGEAL